MSVDVAAECYAALHLAAGFVSAKLHVIEADFQKWEHDNPEMEPVIDEGMSLAKTMLKARGVDTSALEHAGEDALNVAKEVAAAVAVTAPPPNPPTPTTTE